MAGVGNRLLNIFFFFVLLSWLNYWHPVKFGDLRSILAMAIPLARQRGVFINRVRYRADGAPKNAGRLLKESQAISPHNGDVSCVPSLSC